MNQFKYLRSLIKEDVPPVLRVVKVFNSAGFDIYADTKSDNTLVVSFVAVSQGVASLENLETVIKGLDPVTGMSKRNTAGLLALGISEAESAKQRLKHHYEPRKLISDNGWYDFNIDTTIVHIKLESGVPELSRYFKFEM